MKSVTLSVRAIGTGPISQIEVELTDGAPWDKGAALLPSVFFPDMWKDSGLTEDDLRSEILGDESSNVLLNETGVFLGGLLFPPTIYKAWTALGKGLRTYLNLDPELDWIPWETAKSAAGDSVFLSSVSPCLRYREPKVTIDRPVRDRLVMLVVISVDSQNATIGAEKELRFLRETIRPADRWIEMRILLNPTEQRIFEELKKYKPAIFHFIGHGKAGELKLWTSGQYEPWSTASIGQAIDNARWVPELVFLNACRSYDGKADKDSTVQTWSVATTFLEKGASAVIAMQGPASGEVSGLLARQLYQQMVDHTCEDTDDPGQTGDCRYIDVALADARGFLSRQASYKDTRAPYLPALVVSNSPDQMLRHSSCTDFEQWLNLKPYKSLVSNCEVLFPALKEFVDREQDRWTLLDQFAEGVDNRLASIVVGPSGIGKTWLLAWCMDGWLRRRRQVRYVRMSGCSDWLAFVRRVRDGLKEEPGIIFESLPPAMQDELNWRLNELAKGGKVLSKPAAIANIDETVLELSKLKKQAPEAHVQALQGLADVLDQNPDKVPFVLVLDDFGDGKEFFPTEDFKYLVEHFLKARVLKGLTRVRVVISLSDNQVSLYDAILPATISRFRIPLFHDQLADHIRLLFKLRYDKELPAFLEQNLANASAKYFTGERLREVLEGIHNTEELLAP